MWWELVEGYTEGLGTCSALQLLRLCPGVDAGWVKGFLGHLACGQSPPVHSLCDLELIPQAQSLNFAT